MLQTRVNGNLELGISHNLINLLCSLVQYSFFVLKHLLAALLYESAWREGLPLTDTDAIFGVDVQRCCLLLTHSDQMAR